MCLPTRTPDTRTKGQNKVKRFKVKLCKKSCRKCIDEIYHADREWINQSNQFMRYIRREQWRRTDGTNWRMGFVCCPLTRIAWLADGPPKTCPYILEHMLFARGEVEMVSSAKQRRGIDKITNNFVNIIDAEVKKIKLKRRNQYQISFRDVDGLLGITIAGLKYNNPKT